MSRAKLALGIVLGMAGAVVSCNAILGMEKLDPMPVTGAGGDTSAGGSGGEAGQGGAAKLTKGLDCTDGDQCESGNCVDDVCCEAESCSGDCTACNVSGKLGSCAPKSSGSPCGGSQQEPTCNPDYCDGADSCVDASAADGNWCDGAKVCCKEQCSDSCTTSALVEGGTFYRSYDGVGHIDQTNPATVDDFRLDLYEVTVGRFRGFVNSGWGLEKNPPFAGSGAHPSIPDSGWKIDWKTKLVKDTTELKEALNCTKYFSTWTDEPAQQESLPINCITWYEAFAFCIFDGGRLPTEAEWNYAAAGGDEQRVYPWSNPPNAANINHTNAGYDCLSDGKAGCDGISDIRQVGSYSPQGDGRWGHMDLAGNIAEWVLDYAADYPNPCNNCANLAASAGRAFRSGHYWLDSLGVRASERFAPFHPEDRSADHGFRCARAP